MTLIGCLFSWIIMKLNLVYSLKLIDVSGSDTYAGIYNNFIPGGILSSDGPIVDAIVKVFLGWSKYDGPLGSIGWIWLFSALLLLYTKYLSNKKIRFWVYLLTIVVSIGLSGLKYVLIYLTPMMIGMIICDLQYNCQTIAGNGAIQNKYVRIVCIFVGIYMITIPRGSFSSGIYAWIQYVKIPVHYYWILGWMIVIFAIEKCDLFKKFLSCKIIQFFGNISFAVYAVHWPIIISLVSVMAYGLYYKLGLNYELAALLAITLSVPCIVGVAYIVNRYPYRWSYSLVRYLEKKLWGGFKISKKE